MTKEQIDLAISRLIDQALAEKLVRFNRHGVGAFDLNAELLPDGITFDRLGLYDAILLNGNGSAQVRKRKNGRTSIVFNIEPVVEYEGKWL